MNKRQTGAQKEQQVCAYLIAKGVRVKEQNFRCRQGEIDLIGYDGEYLVFFEVKYRSGSSKGTAAEAVGLAKQKKICRVADYYRMLHHCPEDTPIRFDVVALESGRMKWLQNAFPYRGMG
ncbi:MAG: YraN family protein [Clostridiales bacterium]|nr:YraN family protein [Clostridiales bacterium]